MSLINLLAALCQLLYHSKFIVSYAGDPEEKSDPSQCGLLCPSEPLSSTGSSPSGSQIEPADCTQEASNRTFPYANMGGSVGLAYSAVKAAEYTPSASVSYLSTHRKQLELLTTSEV